MIYLKFCFNGLLLIDRELKQNDCFAIKHNKTLLNCWQNNAIHFHSVSNQIQQTQFQTFVIAFDIYIYQVYDNEIYVKSIKFPTQFIQSNHTNFAK